MSSIEEDEASSLLGDPELKRTLRADWEQSLRVNRMRLGFGEGLPPVERYMMVEGQVSDEEKEEIGRAYLAMLKRRKDHFVRLARRFDLVSFKRVANWLSRPRGDFMPDKERRQQAYSDLLWAFWDGEFGPCEKSGMVFFPSASEGEPLPSVTIAAPGQLKLRMTPRVVAILALSGTEPMSDAWAPRESVIRWYKARQHLLPPAPPWLACDGNQQSAGRAAAPMVAPQMRDEEDRRAVIWRRREWRQRWITKFAKRQLIARRWIALVDLVEWCTQSTTTATLDAETKAREVAYRRLTDSLRRGEFERDGLSKILYLDTLVTSDSLSPSCRLTREQFEFVFDPTATQAPSSLPVTVLNRCWLPRELARHWLESHGYRWAPHFEPTSIPADDRKSPKAPRAKPRPPSREKEFWPAARQIAVEWLVDNGCPIPGDGDQAELERYVTKWLEDHGHEASESAVRRHVVRWIKERRDELDA